MGGRIAVVRVTKPTGLGHVHEGCLLFPSPFDKPSVAKACAESDLSRETILRPAQTIVLLREVN